MDKKIKVCIVCGKGMVEKRVYHEKIDACPKGCGAWISKDKLERFAKIELKQEAALKRLYSVLKKKGIKIGSFPFKFAGGTLRLAGSQINNFGKLLSEW